jgi:2-polyprenyl-6-methoxyphenol hydroxylase-like FAD-dependent oxidoreductase
VFTCNTTPYEGSRRGLPSVDFAAPAAEYAPMTDFETVVLGGGPAGVAAAILLARRSHKVALVRPTNSPAGALAVSIPPSALRVLSELGVLEAVGRAGFHRNTGNTVWWGGQPVRRETFATGESGFHVDRESLERVLVGAAESIGVTVLLGTSARSAEQGPEGWTVLCEGADGGRFNVRAPWVVDATGRHGLLAREYREPDRSATTLALVRRYRLEGGWGEDVSGHALIESYEDGWACSLPLAQDVRCITAMVDQRHTDLEGLDVGEMFRAELDKMEHLGATVSQATAESKAWACSAALHASTRYGQPGLLLAGDAGSAVSPLSSYGVKKALASGWLAGIAIHTALIDPPLTDDCVDFFDARERVVYKSYRARSADFFDEAARAHRHPYWTTRVAAARVAGGAQEAATGAANQAASAAAHGDDIGSYIDSPVPQDAVEAAFEEIRRQETLRAVRASSTRTTDRPAIRGHRIVMATHYVTDVYPGGLRYAHNVDLDTVVRLAPEHTDVPSLWTAYNGESPPVPLPDFLTGLSTAFAAGLLKHVDG